jgi:hypothetical protein
MVFVADEGAIFDAPLDVVWEYIFGGEGHDAAHKTTRGGTMKGLNKDPFVLRYHAERRYGTRWVPETMRITFFPPVATVQELLDGPMAGSKWTYVYSPRGGRTQVDVYGEFRSKRLSAARLKRQALAFLANEFDEDVPGVRALARRPGRKRR